MHLTDAAAGPVEAQPAPVGLDHQPGLRLLVPGRAEDEAVDAYGRALLELAQDAADWALRGREQELVDVDERDPARVVAVALEALFENFSWGGNSGTPTPRSRRRCRA